MPFMSAYKWETMVLTTSENTEALLQYSLSLVNYWA